MKAHTLIYQEVVDRDQIELEVPWGLYSGRIPPPTIKFFRRGDRELVYVYVGSKP